MYPFWQNLLSIPKLGIIFLKLVFEDSGEPVKIEIQICTELIQSKNIFFDSCLTL